MKAAGWAHARKSDTVSLFDLQHLSPKAIYALASGKHDDEVVELVLSAAATAQRHLNETDVSDIEADSVLRYPITGTVGCCARAATGHAATLSRPGACRI
jgi:hypothetical protein